jgi:gamma-glutamyltranspeptidase/glutathione hydrolase
MVPWAQRLSWLGVVAVAWMSVAVAPPPLRGAAMVAADHELASRAGAEVLRQGGNAADGAVAAALAAGVVQPASSGLGGGGFAVGRMGGNAFVLDFREVAPAAAKEDRFRDDPRASTRGGKAVAVPGEPRGLAELARRHGRLSLAKLAAPARWRRAARSSRGPSSRRRWRCGPAPGARR